jgi:predicted lipase
MYHNFHLFLTCQNSIGLGGISGFLALDTTNQLIILSFQGSRTIQNWIDNLSVIPVAISNICSGCDAHLGFWSTWQSISDTITPHINAAVAQYPSYGLVFTGHSLGAALATVSATVLRLAGHKIDLVSTPHVLADTREESLIR